MYSFLLLRQRDYYVRFFVSFLKVVPPSLRKKEDDIFLLLFICLLRKICFKKKQRGFKMKVA